MQWIFFFNSFFRPCFLIIKLYSFLQLYQLLNGIYYDKNVTKFYATRLKNPKKFLEESWNLLTLYFTVAMNLVKRRNKGHRNLTRERSLPYIVSREDSWFYLSSSVSQWFDSVKPIKTMLLSKTISNVETIGKSSIVNQIASFSMKYKQKNELFVILNITFNM